jgi:hypothetical protein
MSPAAVRSLIRNILAAAISLILIFAALEICFRYANHLDYRKSFDAAVAEGKLGGSELQKQYLKATNSALSTIIRVSEHPGIVYELLPDITAFYESQKLTTSHDGFRDREYPIGKDGSTVRVIGIGDSVMFGMGVSQGEEYLSVLEEILNEKRPSLKWEVINTAVPGYNTAMEVETLIRKGLKYTPDIVVLGFVGNDFCLPNFIIRKENWFSLRESYLFRFIRTRLRSLSNKAGRQGARLLLQHASLEICDPGKAPSRYRHMVGANAVRNAMEELKSHAEKEGFAVIVVFLNDRSSEVIDAATDMGFHVVNVRPGLNKYMKEHDIADYKKSVLAVSPYDGHPSGISHRIAAEQIFGYLESSGLTERNIKDVAD